MLLILTCCGQEEAGKPDVRQHFAPGLTVDTTHTHTQKTGGEEVKIETGETTVFDRVCWEKHSFLSKTPGRFTSLQYLCFLTAKLELSAFFYVCTCVATRLSDALGVASGESSKMKLFLKM